MLQQRQAASLAEYLTVGQAAQVLGVSPWTLRNWDRAGRLKPRRHPKNGYRIYRRGELESLLGGEGAAGTPGERLSPAFDWSEIGEHAHFVQFYENDGYLMDAVGGFIGTGLAGGEAGIVIATRTHSSGIQRRLRAQGIDVSAAIASGQLVFAEASEMLSKFMVDGSPDAARFNDAIGPIVQRAARGGRRVRAFGEMVARLWRDGNRAAAVRLEELWNDLSQRHAFALFCAYPMSDVAGEVNGEPFDLVCKCHTHVVPAESYSALPSADQRLREITILQQRAKSLEAEIARRKEAEAELSKRERELADFFENAIEGMHRVGPDGIILWANRAELNMLGYEPHEYIGHHIAEFHVDQDVIATMLEKLLRGESLYDYPARLRCKDGSIKHVLTHSNSCFENGEFLYTRCFTRDVTERRRVEEELRQAKSAAEQANKAKDQFLAVLSHELRTPLTPVLMATAAMESEPGLPPRVREDLAMIRRNIALETRLIDDLLDLSRVINGKLVLHRQRVKVHPLIRNVVEMVAADAVAKQLSIELDLQAGCDRVDADSARLHQVIWNLLKNAIKFTPERGRIAVGTRNDENNRLVISVQDSGIGIDPGSLTKIFNPFEQADNGAKRAFGGLGLGLAISKTVVEMHEGKLSAHSDGPGRGACFTVELGVCSREEHRVRGTHSPASDASSPRRGLRVLLVEDHPDTQKIFRRLLEFGGHSVVATGTVAEATRAAEAGAFDVLISDIGLPDGTGLDVIGQIRSHQPQLPAIALTGLGMEQDIRNSEEAGFTAHLTKPIDMALLEKTMLAVASARH